MKKNIILLMLLTALLYPMQSVAETVLNYNPFLTQGATFRLNHNTNTVGEKGYMSVMGFQGLEWKCGNLYYIRLKLNGTPSLCGHNNTISLYNPDTKVYNSIWASNAYFWKEGKFVLLNESSYSNQTLSELKPVSFQWKNGSDSTDTHLGFVAQDVEEVLPELVSVDATGYRTVDYYSILPLIVKAIQEADATVRRQHDEILWLQEELKNLNSTNRQ